MIEEIEKGAMPLSGYVSMHSTTEMTEEKIQILKTWATAQTDSIEQVF